MKFITCFIALKLLLVPHLSAQTPIAPKDVKIIGSGLTYIRYPMQQSQVTATNGDGYVPYTELLKQKPLRAPKTIPAISKWEKPREENAIVIGYIKIDEPGSYAFMTSSGYDRNELIINDIIVCEFRDGDGKGQIVDLPEGLLPIVSAAYRLATTEIRIQWMPPGQTAWSDIPNKLLFRTKVETPK